MNSKKNLLFVALLFIVVILGGVLVFGDSDDVKQDDDSDDLAENPIEISTPDETDVSNEPINLPSWGADLGFYVPENLVLNPANSDITSLSEGSFDSFILVFEAVSVEEAKAIAADMAIKVGVQEQPARKDTIPNVEIQYDNIAEPEALFTNIIRVSKDGVLTISSINIYQAT